MTPLMYAVKDNRTTFIDRMIDLGVDVSARNFVSTSNKIKIKIKEISLNPDRKLINYLL